MSENKLNDLITRMDETDQMNKFLVSENLRLTQELALSTKALELTASRLDKISKFVDSIQTDVVSTYRAAAAMSPMNASTLHQMANTVTLISANIRNLIKL